MSSCAVVGGKGRFGEGGIYVGVAGNIETATGESNLYSVRQKVNYAKAGFCISRIREKG